MHFLNPGYLGARKAFRENFSLPIERYQDKAALEQLKTLTTPFILVMKHIEEEDGMQRRGLVLSMLIQLKQICNHPVQYLHQLGKGGALDASTTLSERSGKLERLGELLEEILADRDRALIFTQFAEMGQRLADYLPRTFGAATQFLHGGTQTKVRDAMVKRFQEDDNAPPVLSCEAKKGLAQAVVGSGENWLTEMSTDELRKVVSLRR